jgi:hypothetical protein
MEIEVIEGAAQFLRKQKNILIVLESVHSEEQPIKDALSKTGNFEFYRVDDLNMASKKSN